MFRCIQREARASEHLQWGVTGIRNLVMRWMRPLRVSMKLILCELCVMWSDCIHTSYTLTKLQHCHPLSEWHYVGLSNSTRETLCIVHDGVINRLKMQKCKKNSLDNSINIDKCFSCKISQFWQMYSFVQKGGVGVHQCTVQCTVAVTRGWGGGYQGNAAPTRTITTTWLISHYALWGLE